MTQETRTRGDDTGLAGVLADVRSRNRRIQELDTQLSELIAEIEVALHAHVNVRIDVDLSDQERLVFGKSGGQWRLMIKSDSGETALASCSRERRTEVFTGRSIDRLLAGAARQIDDLIAQRQDALAKAATLMAALKGES